MIILPKHRQVLALSMRPDTELVVLEGTIRSSKTVVAIEGFALKLLMNHAGVSCICAKDYDTINNNILHSNGFGLLEAFDGAFRLKKDPIGGNYVTYANRFGEEGKVLLVGYDNASSWKKILGLTIVYFLIDEVNIANEQFIDECFARQSSVDGPFMLWTLNGDNPDHPIYTKYINKCKPLLDVPQSILNDMAKYEKKKGWYYYHFNFKDNPMMTEEKIERVIALYPVNSYYYRVKVLGIRGKAEGSIFENSLDDTFISVDSGYKKSNGEILKGANGSPIPSFRKYSIGIDLGNNEVKHGTILTITGMTETEAVVLRVKECKSTEVNSLIDEMADFVMSFYDELTIKTQLDGIWVDGYGAIEMMMATFRNRLRSKGCLAPVGLVNKFGKDNGRRARLDLLMLLVGSHRITFRPSCRIVPIELSKLVYDKDGLPLDENQLEMDYYDSLGYSLSTSMLELNRYIL